MVKSYVSLHSIQTAETCSSGNLRERSPKAPNNYPMVTDTKTAADSFWVEIRFLISTAGRVTDRLKAQRETWCLTHAAATKSPQSWWTRSRPTWHMQSSQEYSLLFQSKQRSLINNANILFLRLTTSVTWTLREIKKRRVQLCVIFL